MDGEVQRELAGKQAPSAFGGHGERKAVPECTSSAFTTADGSTTRGGTAASPGSSLPTRKRHRRGPKRKRGKRQRLLRAGKPTAPFNSTQFLIADHGAETPSFLRSPEHHCRSTQSADSSLSDYDDSAEDDMEEELYFERDFAEAYAEAERWKENAMGDMNGTDLLRLSKEELLRRCRTLEQTLVKDKAEIAVLREENERLKMENESLRHSKDASGE